MVAMALSACANTYVNRTALIASTVVLACDWGQTRSAANAGWVLTGNNMSWALHEKNPLMGAHPSTTAVDGYFLATALTNFILYLSMPRRYRVIVPTMLFATEASMIVLNHADVSDTGASAGGCGL